MKDVKETRSIVKIITSVLAVSFVIVQILVMISDYTGYIPITYKQFIALGTSTAVGFALYKLLSRLEE